MIYMQHRVAEVVGNVRIAACSSAFACISTIASGSWHDSSYSTEQYTKCTLSHQTLQGTLAYAVLSS
jgi:hypothetical protein